MAAAASAFGLPRELPPSPKMAAQSPTAGGRKGGALDRASPSPEVVAGTSGGGVGGGGGVAMSWLRAARARPGEDADADVFDDEADETLPAQREWRSRVESRVREGYRDGVDAGKAAVLQQGFNQGYKEGAEVIINYGQLRGTLSALLCWCRLQDSSSSWIAPLNDLLDTVGRCEESALQHLASPPQPHVADLLDSIQDMDLCPEVSAQKKIKEDGLRMPEVDSNTNGHQRADASSPTQWGPHSAQPNFPWLLEQTTSIVEQLGLSMDILQNIE
ncbi:protein YAE1 homolog [Macrotis lagotis]|uniref:protein YAE1 homolog n=1 Tax=Macrotis lagotis TaxID=92651 RepID=UPI003D69F075